MYVTLLNVTANESSKCSLCTALWENGVHQELTVFYIVSLVNRDHTENLLRTSVWYGFGTQG